MLRIRDVYPGSRILFFSIPNSGSAEKYFKPKKWVISSGKYDSGCSSRIGILTFYPSRIPDPGVKRQRILPGVALLCFGEDLCGGTALRSLPQLVFKLLAESSLQIQQYRGSDDFITQKVYLLRLISVCVGLIMLAAYFVIPAYHTWSITVH